MLHHEYVELAELEAVVRRVDKVSVLCQPELRLHQVHHVRDQVVDAHERAPPVAEDAAGDGRRALADHRLTRHHARVPLSKARLKHSGFEPCVAYAARFGGAVPVDRPRLMLRPRGVPSAGVPRGGVKRLVRRLWRDVRKKGPLRVGRNGVADPRHGDVTDDAGAVVGGGVVVLDRAVGDPGGRHEAVRRKRRRNVAAAAIGKPRAPPGGDVTARLRGV
eukprot:scaffold42993_cov56-Phaeocystis_antarctica.AAC.1